MIKWSKIIEKNENELREELEEAYKNAVDYQSMEFSVELFPDGKIRQNEQAAGSNFQSFSSWNGESMIVGLFCFQNAEIDIAEEMYRDYMTEEEQKEVEEMAEDMGISFIQVIECGWRGYQDVYEKAMTAWKEAYKDEYAFTSAEEAYQKALENAIEEEAWQERMEEYYEQI